MKSQVTDFQEGLSMNERYVTSFKKLEKLVRGWKEKGLKVVLTSGTWDLFHVGHAEYLERSKSYGDLLIVGVDSDKKVRLRKGPHRPVVPQLERINILCHLRHVDVVVLKPHDEEQNALIKLVQPHVLVMSKSTNHDPKDIKEKQKYVYKVVLLEPQAQTSTSAKVRLLHTSGAHRFAKEVASRLPALMDEVMEELSKK